MKNHKSTTHEKVLAAVEGYWKALAAVPSNVPHDEPPRGFLDPQFIPPTWRETVSLSRIHKNL